MHGDLVALQMLVLWDARELQAAELTVKKVAWRDCSARKERG
jgi:hypothetical protein